MTHEDAQREIGKIKTAEEKAFCPTLQATCRKDCKHYRRPWVKAYYFGTTGTSYWPMDSHCALEGE